MFSKINEEHYWHYRKVRISFESRSKSFSKPNSFPFIPEDLYMPEKVMRIHLQCLE